MNIKSLLCIFLPLVIYAQVPPAQWGENVTGVTTQFHSDNKEIALTFDACGGSERSSQYDEELIEFLTLRRIPAILSLIHI